MKNIFIAQKLSNGKLDEICVTILNLNVFGTLTETFYDSIILQKKLPIRMNLEVLAVKRLLPAQE